MIEITDADDQRVDDFRDLSAADRRPDRPGGRGLVIGEGTVVIGRLLNSAYPVRALLGVPRRIEQLGAELAGLNAPVYITSAEVMATVVGFHLNRGVLAVADRAEQPDPSTLVTRSRLLAVLEGIGDHENLGSIFRNAAALGVDGVLLGPGCSDPLYRRSVRVSMGHVLRVPFASLPDLATGFGLLRAHGFRTLALTPRPTATRLAELDPAVLGGRIAVLLGSEGPGLTEDALSGADEQVRIPMAKDVDSLNVATAAAVVFHALGRSE
ncbi:MAG TPA: RNA methyltransferase [Pseudonocardiaceae bacterium]|jgi:tRNA G18 (ribose-2'-O)-methylase SpoU|nr:RNA methyltransferase [Pseudonocardiaceae bacterium]